MSYTAAVDHLYALGHELAPASPTAPRRKFDLDHMRVLAAALGDPQRTFPSVLIAGTNGKGSTAATLSSVLTAAGYRTGLYTSPHLVRVNERIQLDHRQISDDDFARLYFRVDDTARDLVTSGDLPHPPSFFEVLTALAFLYYAEKKVDIAVLEVGLGGRLDATNIVDPLISIITDIALDHQDYLGDTITEITREKAGILRPNGTLITLPQHPEANQAIGEAAVSLNLHAISAADYIPPQVPGHLQPPIRVVGPAHAELLPANHNTNTDEGQPLEVNSPLPGHHQQRNIALAIATAVELRNSNRNKSAQTSDTGNYKGYNIPNKAIEAGIHDTRWPGRLELLTFPNGPQLLLDVAHNPAGAWTLRAAISQLPEDQPRTLIFSCLGDKKLTEMAQILLPLFDSTGGRPHDHIILAPIDNPRAAGIDALIAAARALDVPALAVPSLSSALAHASAITPANGLIIATGSVFLVGEVLHLAEQGPWQG